MGKSALNIGGHVTGYSPEHGVVNLSIHDHGLKHGTFPHHKLDHSVNQTQQIPETEQFSHHPPRTRRSCDTPCLILTTVTKAIKYSPRTAIY